MNTPSLTDVIFFISNRRIGVIRPDGSGECYPTFTVPNQVYWQLGYLFPDGRQAVLWSQEPSRNPQAAFSDPDGLGFAKTHLYRYDFVTGDMRELSLPSYAGIVGLLRRIRAAVEEITPGFVLIANTSFWPLRYCREPLRKSVLFAPTQTRRTPRVLWDVIDGEMVESFMSLPRNILDPASEEATTMLWQPWDGWRRAISLPPDLAATKRQIALPYFGTDEARDTAFYVYASAKLGDTIWETNHSFVSVAPFDMASTKITFQALATIHTPYVPAAEQVVECGVTIDGRWVPYNDQIDGRRQVCAVELSL